MAVYQIVPSQGKAMTFLREHAPDILTYGGVTLMGASVIAAAVGTKKMMEEKDEWKSDDPLVKKVWNRSKHYVATTGLFAAGTFCIVKSDGIMKDRNKQLTETIAAMSVASMAYRQRWKDKVGNEEEEKIFFDEKTEEVVGEDGKKKKVKTQTIDQAISTDIFFDRYCSWRADEHGDMDFDARTIDNVMAMLNNELRGNPERYVLLQHAYDMLGAFMINEFGQRVDYRTVAGQNGGWIYDKENPNGDNTITLKRTKTTRKLEDGRVIPTWRITFNVDGNIMKPLRERGWIK